MKLLAPFLVLVCSLVFVSQTHAENTSTRVTRKKPGDHLWSFTVKVTDRFQPAGDGEYVRFQVTVNPTAANTHPLPHRVGTLKVYNDKEFVSSCELKMTEGREGLTFTFLIAEKYAEKSTFVFSETTDADAELCGCHYWFYLQDFVEAK